MSDEEIRNTFKKFIEEIRTVSTTKGARDIKRRLDEFVKQENVTDEQLNEFAYSGYGEMLEMLI